MSKENCAKGIIATQILASAVAGFAAGGERQAATPGAGWGAYWIAAGEDALAGTPAEELVQGMRSSHAKVNPSEGNFSFRAAFSVHMQLARGASPLCVPSCVPDVVRSSMASSATPVALRRVIGAKVDWCMQRCSKKQKRGR